MLTVAVEIRISQKGGLVGGAVDRAVLMIGGGVVGWCWYRVGGVGIRSSEKCVFFRRDFPQIFHYIRRQIR